jgi:hypothetical protein
VGPELIFEHGAERPGLDAGRTGHRLDLEHPVERGQVDRDHAGDIVDGARHPADHGRASAVGHRRRPGVRTPVEEVDDILFGLRVAGPALAVGRTDGGERAGGFEPRCGKVEVGEAGRRTQRRLMSGSLADGRTQLGCGLVVEGLVLPAPPPPGTFAIGHHADPTLWRSATLTSRARGVGAAPEAVTAGTR